MDFQKILENKTDEELVELTLQNEENFLYIMKRYENKLLRYILRISNVDNDEAQDVLQDVFIKVYKNLNNFDKDLKFSSWIYRITHNQVISNYRKNQSRPQGVALELDNGIIEGLVSDLDTAQEIDTEYLRKNIFQILDKINVKYREVLVLKFLEEKDYKEISDIIKKPIGTVGTLLNRGKKEFKKELDKQGLKI